MCQAITWTNDVFRWNLNQRKLCWYKKLNVKMPYGRQAQIIWATALPCVAIRKPSRIYCWPKKIGILTFDSDIDMSWYAGNAGHWFVVMYRGITGSVRPVFAYAKSYDLIIRNFSCTCLLFAFNSRKRGPNECVTSVSLVVTWTICCYVFIICHVYCGNKLIWFKYIYICIHMCVCVLIVDQRVNTIIKSDCL